MVRSVAAVQADETVLVPSASGGVAGAAVQCLRHVGARVIATGRRRRTRSSAVRELGADARPLLPRRRRARGGARADRRARRGRRRRHHRRPVVRRAPGLPAARRAPGHLRRPRGRGRRRSTSSSCSATATASSASASPRRTEIEHALRMALDGTVRVPVTDVRPRPRPARPTRPSTGASTSASSCWCGRESRGPATTAIHGAGTEAGPPGTATPVVVSSTFRLDAAAYDDVLATGGRNTTWYARLGNPTNAAVARTLAALEGAEAALLLRLRHGGDRGRAARLRAAGQPRGRRARPLRRHVHAAHARAAGARLQRRARAAGRPRRLATTRWPPGGGGLRREPVQPAAAPARPAGDRGAGARGRRGLDHRRDVHLAPTTCGRWSTGSTSCCTRPRST